MMLQQTGDRSRALRAGADRVSLPSSFDWTVNPPPPIIPEDLRLLLVSRPDVQKEFKTDTPIGLAKATLWSLVAWAPEYGTTREALPWEEFLALDERLTVGNVACVSRMAYILWLARPDLRQAMDLNTEVGRANLGLWFLVSGRQEAGLLDPTIDDIMASVYAANARTSAVRPQNVLSYLFAQARIDLHDRLDMADDQPEKPSPWQYIQDHAWSSFPSLISLLARMEGVSPDQPNMAIVARPNRAPRDAVRGVRRTDGVSLVGYLGREMGMGEHIRNTHQALSAIGVSVHRIDGNLHPVTRPAYLSHERDEGPCPYAGSIIHINADMMPATRLKLGEAFFRDRYVIGFWAWELSAFPDVWRQSIDLVDEVWAPSAFTRDAIASVTDKPVLSMPLTVDLAVDRILDRRGLGLPEDRFIFLFTFDMRSFIERKNPVATVRAFKRAFPSETQVRLVFKVINWATSPEGRELLLEEIGFDERIIVIDEAYDRSQMASLFACCDAYVSLHRSEGFGRGPAEAMYMGKPVITTGYSGNMDFTTPENSLLVSGDLVPVKSGEYLYPEGQVWADPDVAEAAEHMRTLFDDHEVRRRIGQAGRRTILNTYSRKAVGLAYRARLEALGLVDGRQGGLHARVQ